MTLGYNIRKWLQTIGKDAIVVRQPSEAYGFHDTKYHALMCYDPYRNDVVVVERIYFNFGINNENNRRSDYYDNMSDYACTIRKLCLLGNIVTIKQSFKTSTYPNRTCDFSLPYFNHKDRHGDPLRIIGPAFRLRVLRPLWPYEYMFNRECNRKVSGCQQH